MLIPFLSNVNENALTAIIVIVSIVLIIGLVILIKSIKIVHQATTVILQRFGKYRKTL